MTGLEENLIAIQNEKNKKIIPANIKNGVEIFGIVGNYGGVNITDSEDYQICLDLSNEMLKNSEIKPYYELDFLQTSGTQYIDTGIIPTNHKVEIKFKYLQATNNTSLFGTTSTTYHLTWYSNRWYYACGNSESNMSTTSCTTLQTVIFNNDNNKITMNGTEYGSTKGTSSATINLLLFARTDNLSNKVNAEFYYMKIYDKSTNQLVRDFIPVEDINGVICLYDKVTKQFFYNIGSGTFVAGPRK